jgi:hypothetical protein
MAPLPAVTGRLRTSTFGRVGVLWFRRAHVLAESCNVPRGSADPSGAHIHVGIYRVGIQLCVCAQLRPLPTLQASVRFVAINRVHDNVIKASRAWVRQVRNKGEGRLESWLLSPASSGGASSTVSV